MKTVKPRVYRIDSYEPITGHFTRNVVNNPERARQLKEHTKRIRKELGIK